MESMRPAPGPSTPERRFREQADGPDAPSIEVGVQADAPLEVNMTDEPGGDPYNHTGSFKRMYR